MNTEKDTPARTQSIDLMSPGFFHDPYPTYKWLRQNSPVHRTGFGVWLVSRYEDAELVLRDPRFVKDEGRHQLTLYAPDVCAKSIGLWMMQANPPNHKRLRAPFSRALSRERIEGMQPRVQAITDELIDRVLSAGRMDVRTQLAFPLPCKIICELMGIPKADHALFLDRLQVPTRIVDPVPMTPEERADANEKVRLLEEYFRALCAERRRQPGDDLVSALVLEDSGSEALSEDEIVANLFLLFFAGHETTMDAICNGLLALHQHPGELDLLQREPQRIGQAVEEMLRFDSSVHISSPRLVTEATELGGVTLRRGNAVMALIASAHRDADVFADPDELRIARPPSRLLAFGSGIHHCIGNRLARMEMEVVIGTLLRRIPGLVLEEMDHPIWRKTVTLRGLERMPARW